MILEVKHFPESQEVMDKDDWFPILTDSPELRMMKNVGIGDSAYARILDETDYMLIGKEPDSDNRIGERRDKTTNGRRTGFQRRKTNERRARE
mgnify:CR=1 FL=1